MALNIGDRATFFLRAVHPTKPALAAACASGVSQAQAAKWFEGAAAPSGGALLALIRAYGPAFLAAMFDDAPDWVRAAERAQMQDELERRLAETRAALDALKGAA